VAAVSLVYDVTIGMALTFAREPVQVLFGLPAAQPPIHVDLNALLLTCVGVGYLLPYRDPVRYCAYLWLFGVVLKGAGAVTFVADYLMRASPPSFLFFAASDGTLAALTLIALLRTTEPSSRTRRDELAQRPPR